jgi:hypothetical protein
MNCRLLFWTVVSFILAVYIHSLSQPHLICCCGDTRHWWSVMYHHWFHAHYGLYFVLNHLKTIKTCPTSETFTPSSVGELQTTCTVCGTWIVPSFVINRDILEGSMYFSRTLICLAVVHVAPYCCWVNQDSIASVVTRLWTGWYCVLFPVRDKKFSLSNMLPKQNFLDYVQMIHYPGNNI